MSRPSKSLADYLVIAVSPALIMALVGSLVFFLLEILYAGRYYAQLQWILFFFVFGAVLIARISMEADIADRAGLYAAILGLVTWLALLRFVEYPPDHAAAEWAWAINLGLIVLIWWCAHRLTWDCTLVDDTVDASGTGLLELTGLTKDTEDDAAKRMSDESHEGDSGLGGWLGRYQRYRAERAKKPHAPGTWVVYFSLAALPLYGLGQTQIPPDEAERRQYVFRLLLVYAASGLGLLLTTCFLGLRRYLRQRSLRMPAAMTGAWLFFGAAIIGAMLLAAALLPRPGAATPLLAWTGLFQSPDLDPGMGLRNKGSDGDDDGKANPSDDEKGKAGDDKDKGNRDRPAKEDDKGSSSSGKNKGDKGRAATNPGSRGQKKPSQPPDSTLSRLAEILKWIVVGIVLLVIAFLFLRSALRFLANFTHWARSLLTALQAWWDRLASLFAHTPRASVAEAEPLASPPRDWSSFRDPFLTGEADAMSASRLLRYSYDALEAWAHDRDLGRQPRETPLEFAERLAGEFSALDRQLRRLTGWYAHLAYARGQPPAISRDVLRELWYKLAEIPTGTHEAVHQ
ncbi:MAG: DUF4129 domain-containing protein [Planctomycetes bacterium]|nr:DUF4129 domain-containing protein [Planctomycetota bacterium]